MRLIAALLVLLTLSAPALADKRVALVIGNSAYRNVPQLANPKNDASDMAAKLEALGFEVVQGEDLDLRGMRSTVRDFVRKLDGADLSLFFYAGHGLQVNGNNYMAPVDAQLASYDDLDFEALPMDLVLSAMERNTKVNLVFLDACRDNPLAQNLARSMGTRSTAVGRGLAKIGSGIGSLIAFATQPGNVALDGKGRNSPFTAALLKHLGTPGESITTDLISVRKDVLAATGGKQVPWDNSSLTGPVVLVPKPGVSEAAQASAPGEATGQKADNAVELAYWDTIKETTDKGFFEAYLQRYPKGSFTELAKLKITALERKPAEKPKSGQGPDNAAELAYWNSIKDAGGRSYFEAYLARWPKGMFADIAGLRIAELKAAEERAKRETAARAEQEKSARAEAEAKAKTVEVAALAQPSAREEAARSIDLEALTRSTQTELARIGCLSGRVDGKWGSGSQGALKDFAGRQGIKLASLEPSAEILDRLKATSVRVCPLVCGQGMEERNGRCVAPAKEVKVSPPPKREAPPAVEEGSRPSDQSGKVVRNSTGRICRICKSGVYNNGPYEKTCLTDLEWSRLNGLSNTCK